MTGEGGSELRTLGPYLLLRPLASGGMADIFLAHDPAHDRHVAVKVLADHRADDAEAAALFAAEGRLAAELDHPNLARVFEASPHYLAMELVHGVDLRDLLAAAGAAGRGIPYATAIAIVAAAARGLHHAHHAVDRDGQPLGLVHRDVSLSNVMVGHDGGVKVVDFGIATSARPSVHTVPGIVRGKASYMAPEQCLGHRVDARTDVFALGVVLYELTCGLRCFSGKTDFDRMLAVVRGDFIRPRHVVPSYPAALERVLLRALALDPAHRHASAAELADALDGVLAACGWTGGPAAIASTMRLLFGEVPAPWLVTPTEPTRSLAVEWAGDTEATPAPAWHAGEPAPSRPRLARGSYADLPRADAAPLVAPAFSDEEFDEQFDDARTRGHRILRRGATSPRLVG